MLSSICVFPFSCWLFRRIFSYQVSNTSGPPNTGKISHTDRDPNGLLDVFHEDSAGSTSTAKKSQKKIKRTRCCFPICLRRTTSVIPIHSESKNDHSYLNNSKNSEFDPDDYGIEITHTSLRSRVIIHSFDKFN